MRKRERDVYSNQNAGTYTQKRIEGIPENAIKELNILV